MTRQGADDITYETVVTILYCKVPAFLREAMMGDEWDDEDRESPYTVLNEFGLWLNVLARDGREAELGDALRVLEAVATSAEVDDRLSTLLFVQLGEGNPLVRPVRELLGPVARSVLHDPAT
jgi:hypothetical protein